MYVNHIVFLYIPPLVKCSTARKLTVFICIPRTRSEISAELFLIRLVATQVMTPSSAFAAGENVRIPLLVLILLPWSVSKLPSLSNLHDYAMSLVCSVVT